ncbi:class I SAM-dependent methyltransferase [Nitrosopumilus sp. S4]
MRFLTRKNVPVFQNLILKSQDAAISIDRGDLNMEVCKNCGFVFNETFDPEKVKYGQNYENSQNHSQYFRDYLSDLINYLIHKKNLSNSTIIEVGCGKGYFLHKLIEESSNIGFGFDPSYIGPKTDLEGRVNFEKQYYDENCTNIKADVIISRHVIEHIQYPLKILNTIQKSTSNSKTKIFFETPSVEWILKNNVFWDFFYEHCSLFSTYSLTSAFQLSGFHVNEVKTIFDGQYLFLEATSSNEKITTDLKPDLVSKMALKFSSNEKTNIQNWKNKISNIADKGKIALWGAGAKGVTFTNLIDPNHEIIDCVIDINPCKQGGFIPGSGHPIVSYIDASKRNVNTAILMNPNYSQENYEILKNENINLELIS